MFTSVLANRSPIESAPEVNFDEGILDRMRSTILEKSSVSWVRLALMGLTMIDIRYIRIIKAICYLIQMKHSLSPFLVHSPPPFITRLAPSLHLLHCAPHHPGLLIQVTTFDLFVGLIGEQTQDWGMLCVLLQVGGGCVGVGGPVKVEPLVVVVMEVELEEVVDELLVDVCGLGLSVQFLEEGEDVELLVAITFEAGHKIVVFLLEQLQRSAHTAPAVFVLDQQLVELAHQLLRPHLPLHPHLFLGAMGEVLAEHHFLFLLQHLLDVSAQQLPDLLRYAVLLLLARLQLAKHRHRTHPHLLHSARIDRIALGYAWRQAGLQWVFYALIVGLQSECFGFGLVVRGFDFGLVEMVGHGGVELRDLLSVGLIAVHLVLLRVVVPRVVVAHFLVQQSQTSPPFHYILISEIEQSPLYLLIASTRIPPFKAAHLHLFDYNKMGNNACCEEEAKAGDMIVKSKFQTSKINVQQPHSKLNTINFNDPPKPYKLIHQTVKPQVEKKEEPTRRTSLEEQAKSKIPKKVKEEVKSREGELPILSKTEILESNQKNPSNQPEVRKVQTLQRILSPTKQEQEQKSKTSPKPTRQQQRVDDEEEELRRSNLLAPELTPAVRQTLETQDIFTKPNLVADLKRYDNEFYEGQLDPTKKYPNGFGKFYKEDESLYVGEFQMGKAHGRGSYIFPNGSYYRGEFKNNIADGPKGVFKSKDLEYDGEFKNNKFHGKGKEKGVNHTYQGEYYEGSKTYGTLAWTANKQKYQYFGAFEANKFNGYGTLKEPKGTYKGEFIKGKKHGNGVYTFNNGLRYQGEYREGQRTGKGVLYNPNNKVAYQGQFLKGLPHGDGSIFDANGNRMSTKWIQGIDSDLF